MIAAIIAASVVVAWLGLLIAMSGWAGSAVTRPKPKRVAVTIKVDAAKVREAMARAGQSADEFGRAFQQLNKAINDVTPKLAAELHRQKRGVRM